MDTKFRSSFIPKVSFEKEGEERQSFGIFGVLAALVFIVSLLATGGSFAYKMMLKSEIGNLQSQTSSALAAIDRTAVNEIVSFDKRLNSVREILRKHVAVSGYFKTLEKETVSYVQFTSLRYSAEPEGNIMVDMNGKAKSFAAIALQEEQFLKNPHTVSANFSGLRVDDKSGVISFTFRGEFKSDLVKFTTPEEKSLTDLDSALKTDLNLDDLDDLNLDNI